MLSLIGAATVAASLAKSPNPLPPVELFRSVATSPAAGLLQDSGGNFYGTTEWGGAYSRGSSFKLAADGTYMIVHDFAGSPDGEAPVGDLLSDASGNLYGTTQYGGTSGIGALFKLAPDGTETVLHSFLGGADGSDPTAGVVMDAQGNLYGTTSYGGAACSDSDGCGTVYKITPGGSETVLHAFTCADDGCYPIAGIILDKKGNIYGATSDGSHGSGKLFEITARGTFKLLYRFTGTDDGMFPTGRLVRDSSGNLYGTTYLGGGEGYGTVFKFTPDGFKTILHSFTDADGSEPYAGLIRDRHGNLYGATTLGGNKDCGTVFELSPDGQETTLHTFFPNQNVDGCEPIGNLLQTKNGNLYGTTFLGGNGNHGTAFVITP